MRILIFCHSLLSDWNHGNAHFLRGIASELITRRHQVSVFEPQDSWSFGNLVRAHGMQPIGEFYERYPLLDSHRYDARKLDLDAILGDAELVLVHEWNDPELIARIGAHRRAGGRYRLLFHDTHHRAASRPETISRFDLGGFDGVLAFGEAVRRIYLGEGWAANVRTWHEAADTRIFRPLRRDGTEGDLVWIGNWGDDERTAELEEFLIRPVSELGLRAMVYGVRYPAEALRKLSAAGIGYGGWLPNYRVPEVFAKYRVTIHVPRRPYAEALPGIPTIRPFEAMACGIPLVSAPWDDSEGLFEEGEDYLMAYDGEEMKEQIGRILNDPVFAAGLAGHALDTIRRRHTCAARVEELLAFYDDLERETGVGRAA